MKKKQIEQTKALMGVLVRMKPKPHEQMKLRPKTRRRRGASAKPKTV